MPKRRRRLAKGIYTDGRAISVIWPENRKPVEKRFPLDTPVEYLQKLRTRAIDRARQKYPRLRAGSFTRDVVRFLMGRKHLPSFKADRAHLRPWVHRFRDRSRFAIDREDVRAAIADWHTEGYSARELRHRWRILSQFYTSVDPDAPNPCRGLVLPKIPKARPRSVSPDVIRDVALNLRKQEMDGIGRLRTAKTRARFLVLATTGQRPAQLKRAKPGDVDLERRIWFVQPAKGDAGTIVYLNDDMIAAWQLFIDAHAWGAYDSRSFARRLRHSGWPAGIRPYNLRHTVGLALSELGVDLGDIQQHMGHASPTTTRIYVPGVLDRLKQASEKLDGRLSTAAFVPRNACHVSPHTPAKTRKNTPDPDLRHPAKVATVRSRKRAKTA